MTLAKALDAKFHVTLIDRKKAFFHSVAGPRAAVQPSILPKIFMPFENCVKQGRIVVQEVREITPTKVVLADGEEITFDYLVIATGTNVIAPFKAPMNIDGAPEYYASIRAKIEQATSVLVVGGGAVGVEMAGEVATDFPGKKVTLVHSGDRLVHSTMNDKFTKKLRDQLKALKIDVILNDKIDAPEQVMADRVSQQSATYTVENRTYTTISGTAIEADLVFWCLGTKLNSEAYQVGFADKMTEHGRLRVNPTLQVEGYENIFAIGDITNIEELKTAYNAAYHANVTAKNISILASDKVGKLAIHKPSPSIMALSVGRKGGVAQINGGVVLGGFLTSKIKSNVLTLLPVIYYVKVKRDKSVVADEVPLGERKRVVIVGAGYAGLTLAKSLDSKFHVTLIDRKKAFFHTVAGSRAAVEPELLPKLFMNIENCVKQGRVINQQVIEMTPTRVVLQDGQVLTFDYLVIATGANVIAPFKAPMCIDSAPEYYASLRAKIEQATSVLVVGGGGVGVEIAGEIATDFPGKKVTIVHSRDRLVHSAMNDKFGKTLGDQLRALNVQVILNDKIDVPTQVLVDRANQSAANYQVERRTYTTSGGVDIEADLVFWCLGNKSNCDGFKANFADKMTSDGRLRVNSNLQVEGYDNIFAIGDITNIDEVKIAFNACFHADIAAKNIIALSTPTSTPAKLVTYKASPPLMVIAVGRNSGLMQVYGGLVFGSFITPRIKSKELFTSLFRSQFNATTDYQFNSVQQ
eukprot:gene5677-6557_t